MDAHMVNYDGRSVYDMLKSLDTGEGGDAQAIRTLQSEMAIAQSDIEDLESAVADLETDKQDAGKYLTSDNSSTNLWHTADDAGFYGAVRSSGYMHLAFRNLPNAEEPETPITEWVQWNGDTMEWRKNDHNGDALLGTWYKHEDSGWITPDEAHVPVQYRKLNRTVFITFNGVSDGAIASNANFNVFNIPVGYRPGRTIMSSGLARLTSSPYTTIPILFIAYSGGEVVVISGGETIQPNGHTITGTFSYPVT